MNATLSGGAVAVIAFGLALLLLYKRNWRPSRIVTVLMLLAGFGLTGGIIGSGILAATKALGAAASTATARGFGVAVPIVLLVLAVAWVVIDMKDKTITRPTPWIALAIPTLMVALGGMYVGIGGDVLGTIGTGVGGLSAAFFAAGA